MWIEQAGQLYNLNEFNQIVKGDEDEILLANISYNGDWDQDEHKNMCSLIYADQKERDSAFEEIKNLLIQ